MDHDDLQPNPVNEAYPYWDLTGAGLSMNALSNLDYRLRKSLDLFHMGMAVRDRTMKVPYEVRKRYPSADKTIIHSPSFNEWELLMESSLVFFISCWENERSRRSDEYVLLTDDLRECLPEWTDAVNSLRTIRTAKVHPRTRRSPIEITSDTTYGESYLAIGPSKDSMTKISGVVHISEQPAATYARVLESLLEFSLCSVRAERRRQQDLSEG